MTLALPPSPSLRHLAARPAVPNPADALLLDHVSKGFRSGKGRSLWPFGEPTPPRKTVYAVNDVSLRIQRNEIYGILGTNGSGKSTLIRLVSTLLLPDAGTVQVFGHDVVREAAAVKYLINRVSVEAAFFKKLSPMENLLYAARLYGVPASDARRDIVRILNYLGLKTSRIYQPMESMSRGMQQKVAIARAFLSSPILLLLDEPTTGLDPRSKRDVQEFILMLRDTHDATIVLTSHDMGEVDRLCDRLGILNNGRLVREDTPAALKAAHAAHYGLVTPATLEDVFIDLTGRSLDNDFDEDDADTAEDMVRTGGAA